MPRTNPFRHQVYRSERPTSPYHLLPPVSPVPPQSAEFEERLRRSGEQFARANVGTIYCVHGTFVGNDVLGLLTELRRFMPQASQQLSRVGKSAIDLITGEAGNYTQAFTKALETGIAAGAGHPIPVRQFHWSSQNNHIARVDGAIQLIDVLARQAKQQASSGGTPPRVQIWAHSHGGNVLAVMSQLLGADRAQRETFFAATRSFYRAWIRRGVDMPAWQRVQDLLALDDHPVRHTPLDLVTFGTPIRYGWNSRGYAKLLHFIHHRPPLHGENYQAPVPIRLLRARKASDGDYVHQIGIAGSNFPPLPIAVRTLLADWRVSKLLEADIPREFILTRVRRGLRVPDAGTTLLVDYSEVHRWMHRHLAGHGLYTWRKWLPFHCEQIANYFYEAPPQS